MEKRIPVFFSMCHWRTLELFKPGRYIETHRCPRQTSWLVQVESEFTEYLFMIDAIYKSNRKGFKLLAMRPLDPSLEEPSAIGDKKNRALVAESSVSIRGNGQYPFDHLDFSSGIDSSG
jgi:hypothetical protein